MDYRMRPMQCLRFMALLTLLTLCACEKQCMSPPAFPAPAGYKVYKTSSHEVILRSMTHAAAPDIPAKLVDLSWDSRFILAEQQIVTNRAMAPGDNYKMPLPGEFLFWIIDTKEPITRYGPFDHAGFAAKLKEIGVPDALRLHGRGLAY
jgi:hypothetical protein